MKHNKYTNAQKLEIVAFARRSAILGASKKYDVDRKCIREWLEKENQLRNADPRVYRLSGGGRKPQAEALEDELENLFSPHVFKSCE